VRAFLAESCPIDFRIRRENSLRRVYLPIVARQWELIKRPKLMWKPELQEKQKVTCEHCEAGGQSRWGKRRNGFSVGENRGGEALMKRINITYGMKVSAAQFELEKFCSLLFDPATGRPFIAGYYDVKQGEYLNNSEEFELLIGGYWVTVKLVHEGNRYYCMTEEGGHQGFRIEFPPRVDGIFLFARKMGAMVPPADSALLGGTRDGNTEAIG
jgi:hypothetical protein